MADGEDALLDFMDLENKFFVEGSNLGLEDGRIAGRVEGKVFGIEKGYEKAIEMGRLRGRAKLWDCRRRSEAERKTPTALARFERGEETNNLPDANHCLVESIKNMHPVPANARLAKHIDSLLAVTNPEGLLEDNADDAVAEFDERLRKARAKIKIITNIIGEPEDLDARSKKHHDSKQGDGSGNIEDLSSLSARH